MTKFKQNIHHEVILVNATQSITFVYNFFNYDNHIIFIGSKLPSSQEKLPIYTAETLTIAVVTSCVGALVVGFISGFLFSRRCRNEDYSDMPFPDQRHQLNRYV